MFENIVVNAIELNEKYDYDTYYAQTFTDFMTFDVIQISTEHINDMCDDGFEFGCIFGYYHDVCKLWDECTKLGMDGTNTMVFRVHSDDDEYLFINLSNGKMLITQNEFLEYTDMDDCMQYYNEWLKPYFDVLSMLNNNT